MTALHFEDIPNKMWAVVTTGNGGYHQLDYRQVPARSLLLTQRWLYFRVGHLALILLSAARGLHFLRQQACFQFHSMLFCVSPTKEMINERN